VPATEPRLITTAAARRRLLATGVDSVAFASNGAALASGDASGKACLWKITCHAR
jgi:hypothetical protein